MSMNTYHSSSVRHVGTAEERFGDSQPPIGHQHREVTHRRGQAEH